MDWTTDQKQFMIWLATPTKQRAPKKQAGFAKELGVNKRTLSRWKNLPGFQKAVEEYRMKWLEKHISDAYEALVHHALHGNSQYMKMLLEVVRDQFGTKTVEVRDGRNEQVKKKSDKQIMKRIGEILEKAGYAIPTEAFGLDVPNAEA